MSTTAFLVFPHQLFKDLFSYPKSTRFCFVEDEYSFRAFPFHSHTLVLRRASMQATRERLLVKGYQVQYFDCILQSNLESILTELHEQGIQTIQCYELIHHQLAHELALVATTLDMTVEFIPTPGFLLQEKWVKKYCDGSPFTFDQFYIQARKKLQILVENGKPVGGVWQLPIVQAVKIPKIPEIHIPEHTRYSDEAIEYVKKYFPKNPGNPENAVFPVTYADSEDWLEAFIHARLGHFSDMFQLSLEEEALLFHAGISPLLNAGLLVPKQVIDAVMDFHKEHPVPLASLELFIRCVIGKREWLRAQYQGLPIPGTVQRSPEFPIKPIPKDITPIIKRVEAVGYCHDFERVIILTSFGKYKVPEADQFNWFMSLFIDSAEWAVLPLLS